jgi:hypothetical protein
VSFSSGDFKPVRTPKPTLQKTSKEKETKKEHPSEPAEEAETNPEAYSCPQEGCVKVFQRLSSLERHLSLEKCVRFVERQSLLDLAKTKYAFLLEEGVGVIPTLTSTGPTAEVSSSVALEGWALKQSSKSYRFNDKQRSYLVAKFNIGQSSGRKVSAETVAKEMRRTIGPDGKRLFGVLEFLTPQQIKSFFSRQAAKLNQNTNQNEADICAIQEEANFRNARQAILSTFQLEHPIVHDQYNICVMAQNGTLTKLKLSVLKLLCHTFQLKEPADSRKKASYITLLEEMVASCSCSVI